MHKIRVVGVKTLESGKFNGDTGEMENPCKGTIKWAKDIPLTEAGTYNNSEAVIMTTAEYEALISGKDWMMPEALRQSLITALNVIRDTLQEKEAK